MATWHQSRRPVQWNHELLWTVWNDPYREFASAALFKTEREAQEFLAREIARGRKDSFIVPPVWPNGLPESLALRQAYAVKDCAAFNVTGHCGKRRLNQFATRYDFPDGTRLTIKAGVSIYGGKGKPGGYFPNRVTAIG